MKKWIVFVMCLSLCACMLNGCGNKNDEVSSASSSVSSASSAAESVSEGSEAVSASDVSSESTEETSSESGAAEETGDESTQESSVSSESTESESTQESSVTSESSDSSQAESTADSEQSEEDLQLVDNKQEGHYTFQNIVCPTIMIEIMGQQMYDTYCNFINAVLAGENSFACPDQETYNWVLGQFPTQFFPVVGEYLQYIGLEKSWENGVGYFALTIPFDEFQQKLTEFEDIVTGILNETLEDDFSDFEKALALYTYVLDNYTYDYELYDKVLGGYLGASNYQIFLTHTGVCQQLSALYSYLLLQAGVDATVMKGQTTGGMNHQWSYITINGKHYHVDPTYALSSAGWDLNYFMMTDTHRENQDFPRSTWVMSTTYSQEHEIPVYTADDETYSALWNCYAVKLDPVNNVLTTKSGVLVDEFSYED